MKTNPIKPDLDKPCLLEQFIAKLEQKIYEPFFLTKKEYYGNEGLGLSTTPLSAALLNAVPLNAIPLNNLVHFYTILDTFMRFPLLYDPEHSYAVISKKFSNIYDGVRVLLRTL